MPDDVQTEELVATDDYIVWISHEPDDETGYHIELGQVTVHLFQEEWDELLDLMQKFAQNPNTDLVSTEDFAISVSREPGEETLYYLELTQATIHFFQEDWDELSDLMDAAREETAKRQ